MSPARPHCGQLVSCREGGWGGGASPWLLLAFFPKLSFFIQFLISSHFESCSSFADSGSPERHVLCCVLPKNGIDAALLKVCYQHIFKPLLLAPS